MKRCENVQIIVYGTETCKDTIRSRGWLDSRGIPYLWVDVDRDRQGYDFVVNRQVKDATTTQLEASAGGWNWQPRAEVPYRVRGNELELAIPRSALGLDGSEPPRLRFKWVDNLQKEGEVMEFTVNGDAAPNGRFSYVFP